MTLRAWGLGIGVSAVAHLGFGAALMAALQPQEIADQPRAKSTLQVTPEVVKRSEATQQDPDSAQADGGDTSGAALGAGAVETAAAIPQQIPQSQAAPAPPPEASVASTLKPATLAPQPAAVQSSAALAPTAPVQKSSTPDTTNAVAVQPDTTSTIAAPTPAAQAKPVLAPAIQTQSSQAPSAQLRPTQAPTQQTQAALAPTLVAQPLQQPAAQMQAASVPAVQTQPQQQPVLQAQTATRPPVQTQPSLAPAVQSQPQQQPDLETQTPRTPAAVATAELAPNAILTVPAPPPARITTEQAPTSVALPSSAPEVTATKAVLAFPDAGDGSIDPTSLAAFQSFTQPAGTGADPMRDTLQSLLSLPCARMQVNFDPVTTTLQVSGHVPDPSQRAPVVAALQAQMGTNIKVTDNLLVLPAPQCGALSGISSVGLPQSTDQITNPLIVGADTHARSFRYLQGDPLVLDLVAPDYPAYVYVDYFDADGNVIHLSPNAQAPLRATTPKQQLQIGARVQGEPGLMVIIGPPYGQEIAVAFAASAPLYQEERPLVEPADAYLAWLKDQVAQARATDPGFKGEWVYFFVQTAAE